MLSDGKVIWLIMAYLLYSGCSTAVDRMHSDQEARVWIPMGAGLFSMVVRFQTGSSRRCSTTDFALKRGLALQLGGEPSVMSFEFFIGKNRMKCLLTRCSCQKKLGLASFRSLPYLYYAIVHRASAYDTWNCPLIIQISDTVLVQTQALASSSKYFNSTWCVFFLNGTHHRQLFLEKRGRECECSHQGPEETSLCDRHWLDTINGSSCRRGRRRRRRRRRRQPSPTLAWPQFKKIIPDDQMLTRLFLNGVNHDAAPINLFSIFSVSKWTGWRIDGRWLSYYPASGSIWARFPP